MEMVLNAKRKTCIILGRKIGKSNKKTPGLDGKRPQAIFPNLKRKQWAVSSFTSPLSPGDDFCCTLVPRCWQNKNGVVCLIGFAFPKNNHWND